MTTKYCPECGKELQNPNAVACPNCGGAIRVPYRKQHDSISIQGLNLSRGNLMSLIGAIGGIIAIFLPWIGIGFASWKDLYSLHALSVLISDSIQLLHAFFGIDLPFELSLIVSILTHYWILLLVLLVVCCYFSIQGGGAQTHAFVGTLQILMLVGLYVTCFIEIENIQSRLFGSLFHFEYGFYISFLCALLLFEGGVNELGE